MWCLYDVGGERAARLLFARLPPAALRTTSATSRGGRSGMKTMEQHHLCAVLFARRTLSTFAYIDVILRSRIAAAARQRYGLDISSTGRCC